MMYLIFFIFVSIIFLRHFSWERPTPSSTKHFQRDNPILTEIRDDRTNELYNILQEMRLKILRVERLNSAVLKEVEI